MSQQPIRYSDAGVSIDTADDFVRQIRAINPNIGGFGGVFPLPTEGLDKPCLVAATDGVGTKLLVAEMTGRFDTIGVDLVAMSVNDLLCCGARPLFFLDYYATGKLDNTHAAAVLRGIVAGCERAGCPLIGGETAELPGIYEPGKFDLAGFAVGLVDRARVIDGSKTRAGDAVIGLESSGVHSNGLSLARKVLLEAAGLSLDEKLDGDQSVADALLEPTRIYAKAVLALVSHIDVRAIAHITGGGLVDNIPRVLPDDLRVVLDPASWSVPSVFQEIQRRGPVEIDEMRRVFNMGIGMILIVPADQADETLARLSKAQTPASRIGIVEPGHKCVVFGSSK